MSDHTKTTEGNEPDGFVVIHYPVDGSEPYGVGPFPFIEELAERLINEGPCPCEKKALSLAFPKGVTMMVHGVEMEEIMAAAVEMAKAIYVEEVVLQKGKPSATDRLN